MAERKIPSDPIIPWYDKAKAAEEKIERMLPVVNAAVNLVRVRGRVNTEFAMNTLKEAVRKYRP